MHYLEIPIIIVPSECEVQLLQSQAVIIGWHGKELPVNHPLRGNHNMMLCNPGNEETQVRTEPLVWLNSVITAIGQDFDILEVYSENGKPWIVV